MVTPALHRCSLQTLYLIINNIVSSTLPTFSTYLNHTCHLQHKQHMATIEHKELRIPFEAGLPP